jgi:hypothetical protein
MSLPSLPGLVSGSPRWSTVGSDGTSAILGKWNVCIDLTELSVRHNFAFWLAGGGILRGWARSASGDTAEGVSWIEKGIKAYRQPARHLAFRSGWY